MKSIDYAAPQTLQDAIALLAEGSGKSRVLAGGTDVIVQFREGRKDLDILIDIKRIPDLNVMHFDSDKGLALGAGVPCCVVCETPEMKTQYPGLVDAASLVGGTAIQSRATIGGNVCNASPAADTIPALIVYRAVCNIQGPNGDRAVPIESFCTAPGKNVLGEGELLVSFSLPAPVDRTSAHYLRFIPRNEMDIAVVGAAASVTVDGSKKRFLSGSVSLGAVAPTPLFVAEAASILTDSEISDETVEKVCLAAQAAATPISDMRGTARQRKHLCGVLTRRAIQKAIARIE